MMDQIYPELELLILEMSEGDLDFKKELTLAIYNGLLELKQKYIEGSFQKNDHTLQQIRHKMKPTLSMFELTHLIEELKEGKTIIESDGFDGANFTTHYKNMMEKLDQAIERVYAITK